MTIWLIGYLFTLGYCLNDKEFTDNLSVYRLAVFSIAMVVMWPLVAGSELQTVIGGRK